MMQHCHVCRAEMEQSARFCTECGAPTREHRKQVVQRDESEKSASSRAALAFGLACVVTLFGLFAVPVLLGLEDLDEWDLLLCSAVPIVLAAVLAGLVGGRLSESFPVVVQRRWLLIAVPAAAVSLLVSVGWVGLVFGQSLGRDPTVPIWIGTVVLAPLLEEWLCRGVAWNAASIMASRRSALVLTSVLFAFLHGLEALHLSLPHRFVAGLIFGWLRLKSGSLLPGILCHALHNAAAVYWFGG